MTGFTPETEACLACHPSQKDAEPMTDKAVDEAVERVRGYVESWDGFDDGTIISDSFDPNDLILGDLRVLLSVLELGRQAQQSPAGLGLHPSALQEPAAGPRSEDVIPTETIMEAARLAASVFTDGAYKLEEAEATPIPEGLRERVADILRQADGKSCAVQTPDGPAFVDFGPPDEDETSMGIPIDPPLPRPGKGVGCD